MGPFTHILKGCLKENICRAASNLFLVEAGFYFVQNVAHFTAKNIFKIIHSRHRSVRKTLRSILYPEVHHPVANCCSPGHIINCSSNCASSFLVVWDSTRGPTWACWYVLIQHTCYLSFSIAYVAVRFSNTTCMYVHVSLISFVPPLQQT